MSVVVGAELLEADSTASGMMIFDTTPLSIVRSA